MKSLIPKRRLEHILTIAITLLAVNIACGNPTLTPDQQAKANAALLQSLSIWRSDTTTSAIDELVKATQTPSPSARQWVRSKRRNEA